jgi:hypothetical protein
MSDVIITVENLGKKYRIAHQGEKQRYTALRDVLTNKVKGLFVNQKSDGSAGVPPATFGGPPKASADLSTINYRRFLGFVSN